VTLKLEPEFPVRVVTGIFFLAAKSAIRVKTEELLNRHGHWV
jgi:hypothetical protein